MTKPAASRATPAWLCATALGAGYSPKAPGTVGSLAALLVAWPLATLGAPPIAFLALTALTLYPAIHASTLVARESRAKDPQFIVIDEVLGQWLALSGALRLNWRTFLAAFILFRFFDILKPPPIRLIEKVPGGAGIVLDDVMAGAYAALILFVLSSVKWFNLN